MSGQKKVSRIVIVGGGFGGVKTALNLAKNKAFQVQLISDNTHFEYHGALYRSAVGRSPMEVVIPLKSIFQDSSVDVVLDSISSIDHKKKILLSKSGTGYPYDSAVLALGNTVNYFGLDGMQQNTQTMHNIASTIALRHRLVDIFKTPRRDPVRIAVIGAGPSGVELASELPDFARLIAKRYQVKKNALKVLLLDSADRVLPRLSPKTSSKVTKRLHELGIEIHLNIQVESCETGKLCLSAGDLGADIIVWTAGSKPVNFYADNSQCFVPGFGGRVVVDEFLRPRGIDDVYVLGDNADTKYAGMAQTALYDANFVSRNLLRQKKGQAAKAYRARKPLYVVTAGQKWAVVERGNQVLSGHRGWVVRRQADLAIFKNFQPYEQAIKTWRHAHQLSRF